jgi:glycerol uptake facilitator-like aquaporin
MIRLLVAEALGSFSLFATVVGSGLMAEKLAGGNVALALIGNTLATAAILFVLITMLGPISGAQFKPAVTLIFPLRGEIGAGMALAYVATQLDSGPPGIGTAHLMFDLPILQWSKAARSGIGQWTHEAAATLGLVLASPAAREARRDWVPVSVALKIAAVASSPRRQASSILQSPRRGVSATPSPGLHPAMSRASCSHSWPWR